MIPTREEAKQKLAVFIAFNTAGHIQGILAIANRLRQDHNIRCVFVLAGPPHSRTIEDHGHELIELEDLAEPFWDFEIEPGEDLSKPIDEAEEQRRLKQGKQKKQFRGAARWPQVVSRCQYLFRGDPDSKRLGISIISKHLSTMAINNSEQIDKVIDELNPDVVIGDLTLVQPTLVKNEQTRPWIRVWSANPMSLLVPKLPNTIRVPCFKGFKLYTKEQREKMRREQPALWNNFLEEMAKLSDQPGLIEPFSIATKLFYAKNNITEQLARCTDASGARIDSPHLNIYMFPGAIDYDQDDDLFEYPPRWLRCDSLIRKTAGKNEAIEHEHWAKQIDTKMRTEKLNRIVYFSLGSVASGEPNLMQRYIDYLASDSSDRLYVVSMGVNGDKLRLAERNMIGANYLPQTFLLQRANLVIIHGGNNSLTEALYYGKPMIVLPAFADQPDNAQRIEDLGLGKRLDLHGCTRDELLGAIDEVVNDKKLSARMHSIGAAMQARDDLGMVSNMVCDLIENRKLIEETTMKHGCERSIFGANTHQLVQQSRPKIDKKIQ